MTRRFVVREDAERLAEHDRSEVLKKRNCIALIPVFALAFVLCGSGELRSDSSVLHSPAFAKGVVSETATENSGKPGESAEKETASGEDSVTGLTPDNAPPELSRIEQEAAETVGKGEKKGSAPGKGGAWGPPAKIRLFGTVEFRQSNTALQSWQSMLKRNAKNPLFVPGSRLNSSTTWDQFKAKAAKLNGLDLLRLVNNFWNNWPYREDRDVYKQSDYWAAPWEFRKNSGDCEDYSIAKYFTLRALGVPKENMRVVVLMETIRNLPHAVLVVYLGDDAYVLDNLNRQVLSHSRLKSYEPRFSINEDYRWAHMKPKKQ